MAYEYAKRKYNYKRNLFFLSENAYMKRVFFGCS